MIAWCSTTVILFYLVCSSVRDNRFVLRLTLRFNARQYEAIFSLRINKRPQTSWFIALVHFFLFLFLFYLFLTQRVGELKSLLLYILQRRIRDWKTAQSPHLMMLCWVAVFCCSLLLSLSLLLLLWWVYFLRPRK